MSKIDPKVFFANERTFLKWLHTSVEIGSIASLLLGFRAIVSGDDDRPGLDILRAVGLILLFLAILFNAYAMWRFHKRNVLLQLKSGIGYEDLKVPFSLGAALVLALCFIFFVYVTENKIIHI